MATCEPTIGDTVTLPGLALSSPGGCLVWFLFSTSLGWKAEKQQKCTTPVRDNNNNNNKLMFYAQSSSVVISGRYTFCHHAPVSERGRHVYRVHTEFSYSNIPKPRPVSSKDQRLVGNPNSASVISKLLLSALATGKIQHTTYQSKPGLWIFCKLNNLFFIFIFCIYIYITHCLYHPFFPFFSEPPLRQCPRPWLKMPFFQNFPGLKKRYLSGHKLPQTSKQCTNPGQS